MRLSGAGLLLRPIEPGDLGALWSAIEESRPELERWMTWCHPQFAEMGLTRIEIVVQPGNDGSARVAQKAGARLEGLCRNRVVFRGVASDASLYSLVPGDLD